MKACVVGLGKIGLPLALQMAASGIEVIGTDISETVVGLVNAGHEPFPGEPELHERLVAARGAALLEATTDTTAAVGQADVVVIVVPLVIGDDFRPDFTALDAATASVARGLRPGTLVCYETTLPVGTTRTRFAPALAAANGLVVGQDLFVCFSPERVYSGRIFADLRRYPKLVGGLDAPSTARAVDFYSTMLQFNERTDLARPNGVWDVGTAEAAELVKLAETTYRDVNIALANEFAVFADSIGLDVYSVIEAANSQPYSHIHQPGIAVGGHCIPVYPHLYLSTHESAQMPATSRRVNDAMPDYAVSLLESFAGDLGGRRVAVLGLAYRGGVKESAFSGVFGTVAALRKRDALPLVHDPLYSDDEIHAFGFEPYHFGGAVDAAVLQADHREYLTMTPGHLPGVTAVIDGRNVLDHAAWRAAGVACGSLGRVAAR